MAANHNIETVRRAWDAWSRGDMEAALTVFAPDVEWDVTRGELPDMGVYHGPEGVLAFFRDWQQESFDDYRAVPEQFIPVPDGRVLVRVRQSGTGKLSGAALDDDDPHAQLWTLAGGKVVNVSIYRSWDEALSAAGMRP